MHFPYNVYQLRDDEEKIKFFFPPKILFITNSCQINIVIPHIQKSKSLIILKNIYIKFKTGKRLQLSNRLNRKIEFSPNADVF